MFVFLSPVDFRVHSMPDITFWGVLDVRHPVFPGPLDVRHYLRDRTQRLTLSSLMFTMLRTYLMFVIPFAGVLDVRHRLSGST